MVLKLFGLKRKNDAKTAAVASQPLVEFQEIHRVVPVEGASAKLAPPAVKAKSTLSPKQTAQRKYAANMKSVRKRAGAAKGGKGKIAKRSGATKLRRELGLKAGKSSGKKGKSSRKKR